MSWQPWLKQSPITEMRPCSHCGKEQPVEQGKVLVCQCPAAVQEQQKERQRQLNWQREQEARRNGR